MLISGNMCLRNDGPSDPGFCLSRLTRDGRAGVPSQLFGVHFSRFSSAVLWMIISSHTMANSGGASPAEPDGGRLSGTHLHLFKEGFDDKWAYPVDSGRVHLRRAAEARQGEPGYLLAERRKPGGLGQPARSRRNRGGDSGRPAGSP